VIYPVTILFLTIRRMCNNLWKSYSP